jgi:PAS fold
MSSVQDPARLRDSQPEYAISETSLGSILDNSPDALARFDGHLRRYVNAATARGNKRPAADFYGKNMVELGHNDETSRLINSNLKKVFETGQETTFDVAFPGPWGLRLFQCRMAPELKFDGTFDYVICFSRDITKEREAERKVIDSERAEAANRLHQQIAHEINNPLQALRNTIYLMKHDSDDELPGMSSVPTSCWGAGKHCSSECWLIRTAYRQTGRDAHSLAIQSVSSTPRLQVSYSLPQGKFPYAAHYGGGNHGACEREQRELLGRIDIADEDPGGCRALRARDAAPHARCGGESYGGFRHSRIT